MNTSLYAHGPASIEVGKYGLPLDKAKEAFLKTVEEVGLPYEVSEKKGKIHVSLYKPKSDKLKFNPRKFADLLFKVARVADLHGDAPDSYTLAQDEQIPEGQYVTTGVYND